MSAHYEAIVRCDEPGCGAEERFPAVDVYASRTPGSTVVVFDDRNAGTTWPFYCTAHTPPATRPAAAAPLPLEVEHPCGRVTVPPDDHDCWLCRAVGRSS